MEEVSKKFAVDYSKYILIVVGLALVVWYFVAQGVEAKKRPFSTDQTSDFKGTVLVSKPSDQAKGYKLRADIHVEPHNTNDGRENEVAITKAYWPNGGYLTFTDCFVFKVGIGIPVECTPDNDTEITYEVELLDVEEK